MKILIVEDDFSSRQLLSRFLAPYGECDVAVNGVEAVEVFLAALEAGKPYDLVCLDIMLPGMYGLEVLKTIRQAETKHGLNGTRNAKIIMTTALDDYGNIIAAFNEQCEAYLVKPLDNRKLIEQLRRLRLIPAADN